MITVMCQEEQIDPVDFIREHKTMIDPILTQLNLDTRITENINLFKEMINKNIVSILNYIKNKKTEIMELFNSLNIEKLKHTKGGRTKRFRKKTKHTKKKTKQLI